MEAIKIVISIAQILFFVSISFGVITDRVFMKGRWIHSISQCPR